MKRFLKRAVPVAVGFALDLALGDPRGLPHPVRWAGTLIARLEEPLRRAFPQSARGEQLAGAVLVACVAGASTAAAVAMVRVAAKMNPVLAVAVETVMCYQLLATRSLRDESMAVERALEEGSLEDGRAAVAMIVGRDTENLDAQGVAKAAVETVAENASDGVIAPLMYMGLGGAPLAALYKAINTMDSMVGYKNERYRHFGTAAARLDDIANFVPARVSGVLMCLAAPLAGLDGAGAWRTYKRDRLAHASPNSAHTEAACAGALGVQLAGGAYYFGKYVDKPTIGDDTRLVEPADITRANKLLYATAALGLVLAELVVAARRR